MNIELNCTMPIDILVSKLQKNGYTGFTDEKHRVISMDLFIPLFVYKYGSLNDFSFFVGHREHVHKNECQCEYTLTCESFGFRYCFPIYSDKEL